MRKKFEVRILWDSPVLWVHYRPLDRPYRPNFGFLKFKILRFLVIFCTFWAILVRKNEKNCHLTCYDLLSSKNVSHEFFKFLKSIHIDFLAFWHILTMKNFLMIWRHFKRTCLGGRKWNDVMKMLSSTSNISWRKILQSFEHLTICKKKLS